MKCRICKKELKNRGYTLDGISYNCCRKCQKDFWQTEPHKVMSIEERIKILLKTRRVKN